MAGAAPSTHGGGASFSAGAVAGRWGMITGLFTFGGAALVLPAFTFAGGGVVDFLGGISGAVY